MTDDEIISVWNNMPGGPESWLNNFGFLQFSRRLLEAAASANANAQIPTIEDIDAQHWAGMDGAIAFHLIERHAENWNHAARLMHAWRDANPPDAKGIKEQNNGR